MQMTLPYLTTQQQGRVAAKLLLMAPQHERLAVRPREPQRVEIPMMFGTSGFGGLDGEMEVVTSRYYWAAAFAKDPQQGLIDYG